jgi:pyruvate formate lyase activating enzyme
MASRLADHSDREVEGFVLRIERSSIHDGAGLRTVVFLKGCPLSCRWCSTPESQRSRPERGYVAERCTGCGACIDTCPAGALTFGANGIVCDAGLCRGCLLCAANCPQEAVKSYGRVMTVSQVVADICKDEVFFFHSGGGVTISGGECLQQPDFVAAILCQCRLRGIDTAIETSLFAPWKSIAELLPLLNTIFVDLKHADAALHKEYVGVDTNLILSNLRRLDEEELPFNLHLRIPLIPGVNDSDQSLQAILTLATTLKKVREIEILPYHRLGVGAYRQLHREYLLQQIETPSPQYIEERLQFLRSQESGLIIRAGGGFSS